jgi:hypothetical protein
MLKDWHAPALIASIFLFLQPAIGVAQSNIGSATSVKNRVDGVIGGQSRSLSSGSSVHANELIRSQEDSVANLTFIDQTKLSVGPKSQVRLDKFVYDPNKKSGSVVIQAGKGAYRFATGVQDSKNYEIKTPYATLGVRGTVLEIVVENSARPKATNRRASRQDRGGRRN